jgi:hypothetical protein
MTAVWSDPDAGTTAGYHINGLSDGETMVTWFRPAVVSALLRDIEELDATCR